MSWKNFFWLIVLILIIRYHVMYQKLDLPFKHKRSIQILSYEVIKNKPLVYSYGIHEIKRYTVKKWIELMKYLEKENYIDSFIKSPLDDHFYATYIYRRLRISVRGYLLYFLTDINNVNNLDVENSHANKFIDFSIVLPLDDLPLYISDSESIVCTLIRWRLEHNI